MYYDTAWKHWESKQDNQAFIDFNNAKAIFQNHNDNAGIAKCLINMAIIMGDNGDYYGSQKTSLDAIQYLDTNNTEQREILSSNYNNLGKVTQNLKDYEKAEFFFKEAVKFTNDSSSLFIYNNNIANNYRYQRRYDNSIKIYNSLLNTENEQISSKTFSRILDNLAFTKFLQNPNYNAEPELNQALSMRRKIDDLWGQNASQAHLSDYLYDKDKSKSLFHAKKMLEISIKLNSSDDILEALQKLVLLESLENSKNYFLKYQKLNDSVQTARSKAKNQFALIRYETEKEKTENVKKQNQILKQYFALAVLALSLVVVFIYLHKRQKRLRSEKEIEVNETRLKYSKKIHDVVANGLYHTMNEIQNKPELSKENILNSIEKMYEESRNIARDDIDKIIDEDFSTRLFELLNSYSSDNQKVLLLGNNQENWESISTRVQSEIFYIIREVMINMKKHSQAKFASIQIEKKLENQLSIKYTDNGIGIENLQKNKTSGLLNMENRIAEIGGEINFDKNLKQGLIISIKIPIL